MRLVSALVSLAALASAQPTPVDTTAPDWSRPRELPSLVVSWRVAVEPCDALAGENVVYVLSEESLIAHDADSGELLWEQADVGGGCLYAARQLTLAGGAVFVGTQHGVYRVDATSGDVTERLALGRVFDLYGPPLLVDVKDESERHLLVQIDPVSGREVARAGLAGSVWSLAIASDYVLVVTYDDGTFVVRSLRTSDLSEAWRRTGYSRLQTVESEIYVERRAVDGDAADLYRVDPATGELGGRLPERRDAWMDSHREPDWELQFLEDDDGHRAKRNRFPTGETFWTVNLPGFPRGVLRTPELLFLHCGREGRGVLVVLDWETGELVGHAYGIRGADIDELGADRLVLTGDDEVVVASRSAFGPSENSLYSVEEEVIRILATEPVEWSLEDPYSDLEALGPDAYPILTRELPELSWIWIQVIAPLLAEGAYRPALEPLAELLRERGLPDEPDQNAHRTATAALAQLGGNWAVPILAEMLGNEDLDHLHTVALTSLVDAGTPDAIATVARYIENHRLESYRFEPPRPDAFADLIGIPFDENAAELAMEEDRWREWLRLSDGAKAVEAVLPSGESLIVYPEAHTLGSPRDLWAVRRSSDGETLGAPIYLGPSAPGEGCYLECKLAVAVDGDGVIIRQEGVDAASVTINLVDASRDRDRDGLSDWIESRISTDPAYPDTDGDGLEDGVDDQPDAKVRPAGDVEGELIEATVEQYFLVTESERGGSRLVLLEHSVARDWRRAGPTLTAEDASALKETLGSSLLPIYSITPIADDERGELPAGVRWEEADRVFRIVRHVGPLNADSHLLVMRHIDGGWYLRSVIMEWIS